MHTHTCTWRRRDDSDRRHHTAIQAGLPIPSGEISISAILGAGDEGEVVGDLDAALIDGMGSGADEGESMIANADTAVAAAAAAAAGGEVIWGR